MKTIAYMRVSTNRQDPENMKSGILLLANEKQLGQVEFVEDVVSGKTSWKARKIALIIDTLKEGDNLIVSEISRLGRSMLECMEILSIATEKGINLYAVKGNWQLDGTIQSKFVAVAFALASEIERDLISQRTKDALRVRKEKGLPIGRPKGMGKSKLDQYDPEIKALLANGATQRYIAYRYKVSEATLINWMKRHGVKKPKVRDLKGKEGINGS